LPSAGVAAGVVEDRDLAALYLDLLRGAGRQILDPADHVLAHQRP